MDIDAADRADHSFGVIVRSSVLRRSFPFIKDLLTKHHLREGGRIEVLDDH